MAKRRSKTLQELTIKDAFMFAAVMSNPERCRRFLSIILDMNVCEVTVITEKSLSYHPEYHGVRLDVLVDEVGTKRRFNVEMQVKDQKNLPPRSRYYHSQIDMDMLLSGTSYRDLPEVFVIFICDFDPGGKGLYRYTNRTVCEETGEVVDDGVHTIWLSTAGTNRQGVPEELVSFLTYVRNPNAPVNKDVDAFVHMVDRDVAAIKRSRDWEAKFMLLKEMMEEEHSAGKAEGIEIGRSEGIEIGRSEGIGIGRSEGIGIGRSEGIGIGRSEGSLLEKQNIVRRLLARNMPDADILALADCEQSLIDEMRKTVIPPLKTPTSP